MRARVPTLMAIVMGAAGCARGPSAPPALAYGLPAETEATYRTADTLRVEINALGQTLELAVHSDATFGVGFTGAAEGLTVTMSLQELSAQLNAPMAGPATVDESIVTGDLVFSLDRRGRAAVISTPEVTGAVGLFSPTSIAQTFFPRLPGEAVSVGDTWVDTVSFADVSDAGEGTQRTVLAYTVSGTAEVDGRSLLEIVFSGSTETDQMMDLGGTPVHQRTELEVEGRVLWDVQRGLMFESETRSSGRGTVEVGAVPGQLPTRVEVRSSARLQE